MGIEGRPSTPLAVNWSSLVNIPTYGYCKSSRNMMLALDRNHVQVNYRYVYGPGTPCEFVEPVHDSNAQIMQAKQRPYDPNQTEVVYAQGDGFFKNQGSYKVGFTMLEVDGLPEEWVRQCNQMDEVWVPSQFNVETFRGSGVEVPIHIIPMGIDPTIYNPWSPSRRYSSKFTFLTVFQWQERKNPGLLIDAFLKGFGHLDQVILVLKTTRCVADELRGAGYGAYLNTRIFIDSRRLQESDLVGIYRGADCFVFPTSGEGWGMPILEAMACGIPTIATDWSAQRAFLNEETGYPIRVKSLRPASPHSPYYRDFRWAEPDINHLIERMIDVYGHRDAAHERSQRIASQLITEWTWDHTARKIIERLQAIKGV